MVNADECLREAVPETKDRILEAALLVFGEKGYHNATMAEIAEAAAVGKGTLYWYFSSKEKLFSGMVEHGLGLLERKLRAIISDPTLSFPGLFTATECFTALRAGADGLKIFPASIMGPSGISALRAVLPRALGGLKPETLVIVTLGSTQASTVGLSAATAAMPASHRKRHIGSLPSRPE